MNNSIMSIFEKIYDNYKIDKPIRLIEMFAGYGSQALALKYLGLPFEHYKISEWAIKSIQAYKDMHFTNVEKDYTSKMSKEELVEYFKEHNISSNYNDPLDETQIKRLSDKQLRNIYNNMKITNNLGSIVNIKGKDLEIVNKDIYIYIYIHTHFLAKI